MFSSTSSSNLVDHEKTEKENSVTKITASFYKVQSDKPAAKSSQTYDMIYSLDKDIDKDIINQSPYEDKVDSIKFPPYIPGSYGYSGRHDGGFLPPKKMGGFYDALSSTIEESKASCDQYILSWMEEEKKTALGSNKNSPIKNESILSPTDHQMKFEAADDVDVSIEKSPSSQKDRNNDNVEGVTSDSKRSKLLNKKK